MISIKNKFMLIVMIALLSTIVYAQTKQEVILAEWDNGKITKQDLTDQIAKIPARYRPQYKLIEGQKRLLEDLVARELFYAEALQLGYDKLPEVIESIKKIERPYYIEEYQTRILDKKANISEKEKVDYYDAHRLTYTVQPNISIRYLQAKDEETAAKIRKALDENVDYIDILNKYSTNEYSKKSAGRIDRIRNNGYIPGIGLDKELDRIIAEAKIGVFVGPFKTETGYHFFRKLTHLPATIKPYEDVKENISKKLALNKINTQKEGVLGDLFLKYNVTIDTSLVNHVNFDDKITDQSKLSQKIVNSDNDYIQFDLKYLYDLYSKSDREIKPKFADTTSRLSILKKEIYFELLYKEALKTDIKTIIANDPSLIEQKQMIITKVAFNKLVKDKVELSKKELKTWYDANKNQFKIEPTRSVRAFIFESEELANKYHQEITNMMNSKKLLVFPKYSNKEMNNYFDKIIADTTVYKRNNGIISKIPKKGPIPEFGNDKIVQKNVWALNLKSMSNVFKTEKKEFAFLKLISDTPLSYRPLDEVKSKIERKLKGDKLKKDYFRIFAEFKEKFNFRNYPENFQQILSAKELFDLAQKSKNSKKYQQALDYYDTIIEKYKDGKNDVNAQFMKGYLYSEEMNDKENAIKTFESFIKNHKDHDLAESAQAMLDDLKGIKKIDDFFIEDTEK